MVTSFQIPCSGSCGKRGSHTVRFNERANRFECNCPGYQFRHKECRHIRFVENQVSSQLLSFEGTPSEGMIAQAIDDILSDYFLMRTHFIYDHHRRARYGYTPKYGPDWKARIGLHASARRELSAAEKAALVGTLRRMKIEIETLESKQVA